VVFAPEASGTRVTGLGFRHISFAGGNERFSAAVVRGGQVIFENCHFRDASGHGLAVIEGGAGAVTGCRFEGNGWDGAAAYGVESRLEAIECQASDNFEHGFDVWSGGTMLARGCTARGNGRNGYCVSTPGHVLLDKNKAEANREFGIVVAASQGGTISGNSLARNELGGMALHRDARGLEIRGNTAARNEGPGLVLDEGFAAAVLDRNEVRGNRGAKQVLEGVKLDASIEAPAAGVGKREE
jgi:parallel beta-helix repeat protein